MAGARISDLLEGITLEDVLDRLGVDYRIQHGSSGEQLNIQTCPFCGGDEWKIYANRETGLGNCFHGSCQTRFNTFKFLSESLQAENARPVAEYLDALAKEIGWRPKRRSSVDVETDENVEWELPTSLELPTNDGENLLYLEERGIDGETARFFKLRFCVTGWYNYTKQNGDKGGMFFGNRVLIPVYDLSGTLVTFQGRDISGTADRKYIFPPGLPGTGAFLFNAHRCTKKKSLVICEGAFDVIRTWQHIKEDHELTDYGVVGTFGIKFSKGNDGQDQLNQLIRLKSYGLEDVTMLWDGEEKAFKAALDACKIIRGIGLKAKIGMLPKGKDPGEATSAEVLSAIKGATVIDASTGFSLSLKNPYRGSH